MDFKSKFELSTTLVFIFQTFSGLSIKAIIFRYDELMTSLSTLKGTVDIN